MTGKIGTMELKNHFVVPPMGTNFGNYEGFVTDWMIEYYRARALGGFGLIIIEVTAVDPHGKAVLNEVGLWKDEQIEGFDTIVLAMGVKPYNPLEEAARKVCSEVYVVGDAKEAGPANKATEAGLAAALAL